MKSRPKPANYVDKGNIRSNLLKENKSKGKGAIIAESDMQAGKISKFRNFDDIPDISDMQISQKPNYMSDNNEDEDNDLPDSPVRSNDYGIVMKSNSNNRPHGFSPPPLPHEVEDRIVYKAPLLPSEIKSSNIVNSNSRRPISPIVKPYHEINHSENTRQTNHDIASNKNHPTKIYNQQYDDNEDDDFDDWNDDSISKVSFQPKIPSGGGGAAKEKNQHSSSTNHSEYVQKASSKLPPSNKQQQQQQQHQQQQQPPYRAEREAIKEYAYDYNVNANANNEPKPLNYKPYTLQEYRKIKPQTYIEYSKLKPDLNSEELVAKRANAERIKEFSKNLKAYNKDTITKLKAEQDMYGDADDKKQQMSSRDKAIAFAKNIPKPKVKTPSNDLGNKNGMAMGNNVGVEVEPVNELDELELKHLQSRKQVEAIKRSLGL